MSECSETARCMSTVEMSTDSNSLIVPFEPILELSNAEMVHMTELNPMNSDVHIIHCERSLDPDIIVNLKQQLNDRIDAGESNIILHVEKFGYLHSIGIPVVIKAQQAAKQRGGMLVIVCSDDESLKRFTLIGLHKKIEIAPTEVAALELFRNREVTSPPETSTN